ncbi:MAG TPA: enoyl-CoA hydratase/isomerase family protein [Caulobacter sp.]|nr:enoyl-CoA hydratase/isomerase family protein [Caulobacter sp.]
MSDLPEVLVRIEGSVGRLTLNRSKALHALTAAMCGLMIDALVTWLDNPRVKLVLIDHAGDRGFCAGGDIRMLAASGAGDGAEARAFFHLEYQLNHLLFEYPKPVVTIMDGVTMGGGVGLSAPAGYRVATERTTYAMPETGIGLFPDVGGGWFLPRMPDHIGFWLALTGARLKAADCLLTGAATHYIESDRLEALKAALIATPSAAETLLTGSESSAGPAPLSLVRADIDRIFAADTVEAIVAALRRQDDDWARRQLETLAGKSPRAMKVALRQLRCGATARSFAENMAMEYRIGARVVGDRDFLEGVRAVIVDKDNSPVWRPSRLEDVTADEIDRIFAPLEPAAEWTPLSGVFG